MTYLQNKKISRKTPQCYEQVIFCSHSHLKILDPPHGILQCLFVFFLSEFDECVNNPCQNGGTCVDLLDSYHCTCRDGYNGTNCQYGNAFFCLYQHEFLTLNVPYDVNVYSNF